MTDATLQLQALDESATAFLARFPSLQRGPLGNLFYSVVRQGVTDPDEIVRRVLSDAERQIRTPYVPEEKKEVLRTMATALLYDRASVDAFIRYVLHRENLSLEDRQKLKAAKGQEHVRRHMEGLPPTEAQLRFLTSLGYDGPLPKNRLEASDLISQLKDGAK
jgi:hypothetical protein